MKPTHNKIAVAASLAFAGASLLALPSVAAADESAKQTSAQVQLPEWINTLKFKGDIRNRFETNDTDGKPQRERFRVRYRLGIIANPVEHIEIGAGLATGSGDPRSTNQSYDDAFSAKNINLSYAYGQFHYGNFRAIAGKFDPFDDYLFISNDLMWDSDIRPEGLSLNYNLDSTLGTTFINGGYWVLEEDKGSKSDPYMVYAQLGQKLSSGPYFATAAATWYSLEEVEQTGATAALADSNIGRESSASNSINQFRVAALNVEVGSKALFNGHWKGSLFGNVLNNSKAKGADTAWSLGAKLGTGPWGFKYMYADLDRNAVPDIFPDSDRFGGATNITSHELGVEYSFNSNVEVGLDYYHSKDKSTGVKQNLLQADVSFKF